MAAPAEERVTVLGLGYVGLPLALAFAKVGRVIGFDKSPERVEALLRGEDWTGEVAASDFAAAIELTSDPERLASGTFHIVAVPTPVDQSKRPDLGPLAEACRLLGPRLAPGSVVVFESTVYPGVTEEVCLPLLEQHSGKKCGRDFHLGYSPERINPGDREHTLARIPKVVSARDAATLERVSRVYSTICKAGVVRAPAIRVAEAAKVIENTQRDLNIALMNELAMIFHSLDIDIHEVLEVAGTKWNFLKFHPGLVGGHCIGVDPYYLAHKAEAVGFHPEVILAGRRTNDGMGKFIAEATIKSLICARKMVQGARVAILGATFKEDVPDLRNSKVADIIAEMKSYDLRTQIVEPVAHPLDLKRVFGRDNTPLDRLEESDAVILAVPHRAFRDLDLEFFRKRMSDPPVLIDVRGVLRKLRPRDHGFVYWSL
ncbi:MAG: nucleotide sugar dehydrogenase [Planctomycetota bacterium]